MRAAMIVPTLLILSFATAALSAGKAAATRTGVHVERTGVEVVLAAAGGQQCLDCSEANEAGAKFCKSCGAPMAKSCGACGDVNAPDARFCDNCGGKLV